jgi:hypothetical protein
MGSPNDTPCSASVCPLSRLRKRAHGVLVEVAARYGYYRCAGWGAVNVRKERVEEDLPRAAGIGAR